MDLTSSLGGLGLGYTAKAVLEHQKVASLLVVEALEAVIEWHAEGLVPLGPELTGDLRCRFVQGDFFALAASEAGFDPAVHARRFDAVLVDIDHSPDFLLKKTCGQKISAAVKFTLGRCSRCVYQKLSSGVVVMQSTEESM